MLHNFLRQVSENSYRRWTERKTQLGCPTSLCLKALGDPALCLKMSWFSQVSVFSCGEHAVCGAGWRQPLGKSSVTSIKSDSILSQHFAKHRRELILASWNGNPRIPCVTKHLLKVTSPWVCSCNMKELLYFCLWFLMIACLTVSALHDRSSKNASQGQCFTPIKQCCFCFLLTFSVPAPLSFQVFWKSSFWQCQTYSRSGNGYKCSCFLYPCDCSGNINISAFLLPKRQI